MIDHELHPFGDDLADDFEDEDDFRDDDDEPLQ